MWWIKRKRDKAIRELVRVARPGAPIAVSVMSRLSVLVVELTMFPEEVEMPHYQKLLNTGDYLGGLWLHSLPFLFAGRIPRGVRRQRR